MGKKLHPALQWEQDQIARAVYWTACQFLGVGKYDTRKAATLDEARSIAASMPAGMGPVMIYAVTPENWTIPAEQVTPTARRSRRRFALSDK